MGAIQVNKQTLENYDNEYYRMYTGKSEIDKAFHTLEGILKGIGFDGIVDTKEVDELREWCERYSKYVNRQPLSEVLISIKKSLVDGILDSNEKEDILWLCNSYETGNVYYDVITSDIQRLQGILHGILADGIIGDNEILELKKWINDNDQLIGTYPYDEINSLLTTILSDGQIDNNERNMLKLFFSDYVNTKTSCNINKEELDELRKEIHIDGICTMCPEIIIPDKKFCFTGTSTKTSRSEINKLILSLGGIYHDGVVSDTDYLIVGNDGNKCWAFSCYGRKVEKAVTLRKKGKKIAIIHENDFWDTVEDIR